MRNEIFGNIIIDPSVELVPAIHIPPMTNAFLKYREPTREQIDVCSQYLRTRFGIHYLVPKTRNALRVALEYYKLKQDDVITILTTTGNFYISSCVTNEIENVCQWNREITDKTKLLFVNHEFGYPYANLTDLKKYNLPIIEDCAYAFFTEDEQMGTIGDFVIYSLPKAFPMQMGGILKSNIGEIDFVEDEHVRDYILNHMAAFVSKIDSIKSTRLSNWHIIADGLRELGAFPWSFASGVVPGVMLFYWDEKMDFPRLKEFMQNHGVECSVFYGKPAFFIFRLMIY